uniref:7TM_GPCR_Srx domain-containing protein n=1 Tax=Globodera pallida TaxID=36090 RepID=A0A183C1U9_GLOPA
MPIQDHSENSRRIFRSVSAIMLLEVLGWLTNNLLRLILPLLKLNTLDTLYYSNSVAFILYAINCRAKWVGAVLHETAIIRNSGSGPGISRGIWEQKASGFSSQNSKLEDREAQVEWDPDPDS